MGYTDLHTHTSYCDGRDGAETMVLAAIERGVDRLGILTHSYVEFDKGYSISPDDEEKFIAEVNALKKKYKGKIEVLCGVEYDYYATRVSSGYDYVLGSVHYLKPGEEYRSIDMSRESLLSLAEEKFGGDMYAVAEAYYRLVADVVRKTGADVIGHFDLITKFNEGGALFDTSHPRYVSAWRDAVDALIPYGIPFEINTGAISRGHRKTPYPAPDIIEYIRSKGGSFILSSDAHSAGGIAYLFQKYEELL